MPKCSVYQCSNSADLFKFPRNVELRNKWLAAIKRDTNFEPKDTSVVCEAHFTKEDFVPEAALAGLPPALRRRLKRGAIPTIFSWNDEGKVVKKPGKKLLSNRLKRKLNLKKSFAKGFRHSFLNTGMVSGSVLTGIKYVTTTKRLERRKRLRRMKELDKGKTKKPVASKEIVKKENQEITDSQNEIASNTSCENLTQHLKSQVDGEIILNQTANLGSIILKERKKDGAVFVNAVSKDEIQLNNPNFGLLLSENQNKDGKIHLKFCAPKDQTVAVSPKQNSEVPKVVVTDKQEDGNIQLKYCSKEGRMICVTIPPKNTNNAPNNSEVAEKGVLVEKPETNILVEPSAVKLEPQDEDLKSKKDFEFVNIEDIINNVKVKQEPEEGNRVPLKDKAVYIQPEVGDNPTRNTATQCETKKMKNACTQTDSYVGFGEMVDFIRSKILDFTFNAFGNEFILEECALYFHPKVGLEPKVRSAVRLKKNCLYSTNLLLLKSLTLSVQFFDRKCGKSTAELSGLYKKVNGMYEIIDSTKNLKPEELKKKKEEKGVDFVVEAANKHNKLKTFVSNDKLGPRIKILKRVDLTGSNLEESEKFKVPEKYLLTNVVNFGTKVAVVKPEELKDEKLKFELKKLLEHKKLKVIDQKLNVIGSGGGQSVDKNGENAPLSVDKIKVIDPDKFGEVKEEMKGKTTKKVRRKRKSVLMRKQAKMKVKSRKKNEKIMENSTNTMGNPESSDSLFEMTTAMSDEGVVEENSDATVGAKKTRRKYKKKRKIIEDSDGTSSDLEVKRGKYAESIGEIEKLLELTLEQGDEDLNSSISLNDYFKCEHCSCSYRTYYSYINHYKRCSTSEKTKSPKRGPKVNVKFSKKTLPPKRQSANNKIVVTEKKVIIFPEEKKCKQVSTFRKVTELTKETGVNFKNVSEMEKYLNDLRSCVTCKKVLPKDHLEHHVKNCLPTWKCEICFERTLTLDLLVEHLQTHQEPCYLCKKCGVIFLLSDLDDHELTCHLADRSVLTSLIDNCYFYGNLKTYCKLCQKSFGNFKAYGKHVYLNHKNQFKEVKMKQKYKSRLLKKYQNLKIFKSECKFCGERSSNFKDKMTHHKNCFKRIMGKQKIDVPQEKGNSIELDFIV